MSTTLPPIVITGADATPEANEPPWHLREWLLNGLVAVIQAPVSIPMSLLWFANAQWYALAESRLRTQVHQIKTVLPAAWSFYHLFGNSPYHYKDHFSHLASHSGEAAWIAEAVVGDYPAYRWRLNLPIRVTLLTRKVYPKGPAEYSIAAVERSDRSFAMISNGFQMRLTEADWDRLADEFLKPGGWSHVIQILKQRQPPDSGDPFSRATQ